MFDLKIILKGLVVMAIQSIFQTIILALNPMTYVNAFIECKRYYKLVGIIKRSNVSLFELPLVTYGTFRHGHTENLIGADSKALLKAYRNARKSVYRTICLFN